MFILMLILSSLIIMFFILTILLTPQYIPAAMAIFLVYIIIGFCIVYIDEKLDNIADAVKELRNSDEKK